MTLDCRYCDDLLVSLRSEVLEHLSEIEEHLKRRYAGLKEMAIFVYGESPLGGLGRACFCFDLDTGIQSAWTNHYYGTKASKLPDSDLKALLKHWKPFMRAIEETYQKQVQDQATTLSQLRAIKDHLSEKDTPEAGRY